jgi:hypothetical protein
VARLDRQVARQHVLLDRDRGVREQDQADPGRVHRHPAADPVQHPPRLMGRQPLDQHRLVPVADRQQHVLAGRVVQVLHIREGGRAQPVPPRRQRRDLEQPQPDHVAAVLVAFERAQLDQLPGDAQGGRGGQPGSGAQRGERERAVARAERGEDAERPVQHRLAVRRPPAAGGDVRRRGVVVAHACHLSLRGSLAAVVPMSEIIADGRAADD